MVNLFSVGRLSLLSRQAAYGFVSLYSSKRITAPVSKVGRGDSYEETDVSTEMVRTFASGMVVVCVPISPCYKYCLVQRQ
jgi:hypothetical protein